MIYYYIYIYIKQEYKSLLPLNEKNIFENIPLVVVKMKSDIMKVVNMKFPHISYTFLKLFFNFMLEIIKEKLAQIPHSSSTFHIYTNHIYYHF